MNKTNGIRLFFILAAFLCIGGYAYGYHRSTGSYPEGMEPLEQIIPENTANEETEQVTTEYVTEEVLEAANIQQPVEYILVEEDGYLSVYYASDNEKYMDTDIKIEALDRDMRAEVENGKKFKNSEELYSFLENYSS